MLTEGVLIDNFTLQGVYGYLFDSQRGGIYENCLANFIETIVIQDKILIPAGVSSTNAAVARVMELLGSIICESDIALESDRGWEYTKEILSPVIVTSYNAFAQFESEKERLLRIDATGRPGHRFQTFAEFCHQHSWYTYHCVNIAREAGINYCPNPTRVPLLQSKEFNEKFLEPYVSSHVREQILDEVEDAMGKRIQEINAFFRHKAITIDVPLIYRYITKGSPDPRTSIIEKALAMRESKGARAYRSWCRQVEKAAENEDIGFLSSELRSLKEHAAAWSENLGQRSMRKVQINLYFFQFDVYMPLPDSLENLLEYLTEKKHLVFLHTLLR